MPRGEGRSGPPPSFHRHEDRDPRTSATLRLFTCLSTMAHSGSRGGLVNGMIHDMATFIRPYLILQSVSNRTQAKAALPDKAGDDGWRGTIQHVLCAKAVALILSFRAPRFPWPQRHAAIQPARQALRKSQDVCARSTATAPRFWSYTRV